MEAMVFPFIVFSAWAISRLGDIRDELGRIRRILEKQAEEGE